MGIYCKYRRGAGGDVEKVGVDGSVPDGGDAGSVPDGGDAGGFLVKGDRVQGGADLEDDGDDVGAAAGGSRCDGWILLSNELFLEITEELLFMETSQPSS
jgi:hypothetical protein